MHCDILLSIFTTLLRKRRTTAEELSQAHGISPRTVYRYVAKLAPFLPLHVLRGRGGGICLADSFKLPVEFLTAEEYRATLDALRLTYATKPNEALLSAQEKLLSKAKEQDRATEILLTGAEILLRPKEEELAQKLRFASAGIRKRKLLHLLLENKTHVVEPHLLLWEEKEWRLFTFDRTDRAFQTFEVEKITGITLTDEPFRPRKIDGFLPAPS